MILIKGGLELNAGQLRRLSGVVARLTLLPCIAEAVAAGTAAHLILPNFSWVWGLTLGYAFTKLVTGDGLARYWWTARTSDRTGRGRAFVRQTRRGVR